MKNTITTMDDLKNRILELEMAESSQMELVKEHAKLLTESLKPAALLKSTLFRIVGSKTVQHNVVDTSMGLAGGWLARKLYSFNSKSIFRKVTGSLIQFIAKNIITNKMPVLREKISDR